MMITHVPLIAAAQRADVSLYLMLYVTLLMPATMPAVFLPLDVKKPTFQMNVHIQMNVTFTLVIHSKDVPEVIRIVMMMTSVLMILVTMLLVVSMYLMTVMTATNVPLKLVLTINVNTLM